MTQVQSWLHAFRLRTLPLAFSSILLGAFLAASEGHFKGKILLLALLTTLFLQILSNLANDYGDYVKGTDNDNRIGPERSLQAGLISVKAMKGALILFSLLSFVSGITLLQVSGAFYDPRISFFFLGLGLICILAAITYTVGKNAYGYKGLGDISVLFFFGFVGVLGTHFLMANHFNSGNIPMAIFNGLLATGVLNLNNLRDIENDKASGKNSIPVLIGFRAGKVYHFLLISFSYFFLVLYFFFHLQGLLRFGFLFLLPAFVWHIYAVWQTVENRKLDPFLKQLALTSLFSTLSIGCILVY